jgi:uncharacterized protein
MDTRLNTSAITYFKRSGRENTTETLNLAKQRAAELGIKSIVVASTGGETGIKAAKLFKEYRVIVVSHSHGFAETDKQELDQANRLAIESNGGVVLTMTHAFAGIPRAIRRKFNTYQNSEIIAYTLRTFGEGMKVVFEISMMAADAGLIKTTEDVIAIGGTGRGADTAVVLRAANTQDFFDLKIKEIICKPRL